MQVQRMLQCAQVEEAPVHRVTLHEIEPLGVGPRVPVEGDLHVRPDAAQSRGIGEHEPVRDQEDPVRWRTRTVHHEHALQLAVVETAGHDGWRHRATHVVEEARGIRTESELVRRARRDGDAVGRDPSLRAEPVHPQRLAERVAHRRANLRAERNAEHRARCRPGPSRFAERGDGVVVTLGAVGHPGAVARVDPHGEHAAAQRAGGAAIVVRLDPRVGPHARHLVRTYHHGKQHERDDDADGGIGQAGRAHWRLEVGVLFIYGCQPRQSIDGRRDVRIDAAHMGGARARVSSRCNPTWSR